MVNAEKTRPFLKTSPFFSFVIPVYDRARLVYECMQSALSQTYENFEVVVVLDGSPPETESIISMFLHEPRVRVFKYSQPFGTACRARNRGILEAYGKYICLLDSDDLATPNRLSDTKRVIDETDADVVYGAVRFLVEASRRIPGIEFGDVAYPKADGFSLAELQRQNQLYTLSAAIRRECLIEYGGFRLDLKYMEDYELWLRLCSQGAEFRPTMDLLGVYRIHGGNNELNFKKDDDLYHRRALDMYATPFVNWGI